MRVLVTWGSKRGGTAGIGRVLADALAGQGVDVVARPVREVKSLDGFNAAIVGGALYANRWPRDLRHFINGHIDELRTVPVWLFSSGPLDDSADCADIRAPRQVTELGERIGAKEHVTFGGRLEPDAKGFPASAMARKKSGDWRNPDRIRAWAGQLAAELSHATPGTPVERSARSAWRLLAHGMLGWALCAAIMLTMFRFAGLTTALIVHAVAAPTFFALIARHYFHEWGARDPMPAAAAWVAIVVLLDLIVVAGIVERSLAMFASVAGFWLPLALIFVASAATGAVMVMMPDGGAHVEPAGAA